MTLKLEPVKQADLVTPVPLRRLMHPCCAISIAVILLTGCDRDSQIVAYQAPKDSPDPAAVEQPQAALSMTDLSTAGHLEWTVPANWRQEPGLGGMQVATLIAGDDPRPFVVTVTRLAGEAGSLLANVNRWRRQLGLDAIGAAEPDSLIQPIQTTGVRGRLVDLIGPPPPTQDRHRQRMLVAQFEHGRSNWFFKVTADEAVVKRYEPQFMSLLRSVRPAAPADTGGAQVFEVGPIRGIIPPGWQWDPRPRPPRLATFVISDGNRQAEVAITRFPGDVGGTLANVNRWRRQVDLSAIDDLSQLDSAQVIIDKLPGKVFQFRAPGDVPDRPRIVVATVKRDDVSWFFKLSGPHDLLESQIEPFVTFVVAIEFTDEADT